LSAGSVSLADDDRTARYLAALGQNHRLRIFRLLMESELCVCELEEQLGLSPSLLAHHLRKLRQSGLIQVRRGLRDARWLYYSIEPEACALLQEFLGFLCRRQALPAKARCGSSCSCG
jgi:ArsR family transcriptional regulator